MNRRQFITAAASAATLAAAATKYDLVVKGGRVIDPSRKLDAVRDVAIANGRIAAIAANLHGDAAETIDATGKLVVPGLIDIHTHAARSKDAAPLCLADGVTCWIDAAMVSRSCPRQISRTVRSSACQSLKSAATSPFLSRRKW